MFICNINVETRHHISVCSIGLDITHFHMYISSETRYHIFVCNIRSDILHSRM